MRQRLVNVLESDEKDPCAEAALRRFWARAAPRIASGGGRADAQVIDLARWPGRGDPRTRG